MWVVTAVPRVVIAHGGTDMADAEPGLTRLDDSMTPAAGERDVRRYSVVDANNDPIGKVVGLYVDELAKVRFLHVRGRGFLGGDTDWLVPLEAVDRVTGSSLYLSHSRTRVSGAPPYDPTLVAKRSYWSDLYGWFGYPPYWSGTYPVDPTVASRR
jgi:hypothetical protein